MAHIFFSANKFLGAANLIQKLALLYKILKKWQYFPCKKRKVRLHYGIQLQRLQ